MEENLFPFSKACHNRLNVSNLSTRVFNRTGRGYACRCRTGRDKRVKWRKKKEEEEEENGTFTADGKLERATRLIRREIPIPRISCCNETLYATKFMPFSRLYLDGNSTRGKPRFLSEGELKLSGYCYNYYFTSSYSKFFSSTYY